SAVAKGHWSVLAISSKLKSPKNRNSSTRRWAGVSRSSAADSSTLASSRASVSMGASVRASGSTSCHVASSTLTSKPRRRLRSIIRGHANTLTCQPAVYCRRIPEAHLFGRKTVYRPTPHCLFQRKLVIELGPEEEALEGHDARVVGAAEDVLNRREDAAGCGR